MNRSRTFGVLATAVLVPTLLASCGGASESLATEDETTQEQTEEPTTEEPTTEDPTTEDPTTEEPTAEDPTTEEPTTEEPTTEDPTTEEPTSDEPVDGVLTDSEGVWTVELPEDWQPFGVGNPAMYTLSYANPDGSQSFIIGDLGGSPLPPAEDMRDQLALTQPTATLSVVDNPPSIDGMETIAISMDADTFSAALVYVHVEGTLYEFTINGLTPADRDSAVAYLDTVKLK